MPATALIRAYQGASALALPFVARGRINRLRRAGLPVHRAHEILGHATISKPLGPLIWAHATSEHEARTALPLIEGLLQLQPALRFLVTSVTPSSAEALAKQIPYGAMHQFAPLDAGGPVRRFLKHWRPDMGIFVESEVWPNLLETTAQAGLPLGLVNARLSERARSGWQRAGRSAGRIFGHFGLIHCRDAATETTLHTIGLRHARRGVNLKSLVRAPKPDPLTLARLRKAIGTRPVWSAISTHPGEDEIMIEAHTRLRHAHSDALLILVPHDPERATRIRSLAQGHSIAQRSSNHLPDDTVSIFLADTFGETDLWLTLARLCCLCGTFAQSGGQSPLPAIAAEATVLHGPHHGNHQPAYAALTAMQGSLEVHDASSLAQALDLLVRDPSMADSLAKAAQPLVQADQAHLKDLARQCLSLAQIPIEPETPA